jgi:hypothetical protein
MKPDPITLIFLVAGVLMVGAVGAFFLYVSPLTIIYVVITLLAILLMFGLGVVWGREAVMSEKTETDTGIPGLTARGYIKAR